MRDILEPFRHSYYAAREGAEFIPFRRLAEIIRGWRAVWYISFRTRSINAAHVPVRFSRLAAMRGAILSLSSLRWFDPDLRQRDNPATPLQIVAGVRPVHSRPVFSSRPFVRG
jgi:hypothetical protein